jgi:hypothetical protein
MKIYLFVMPFMLVPFFSGVSASADENKMYQCLDAIEGAERFEIHTTQAPFMRDLFKKTTFEGKTMSWFDVQEKLIKAGYMEYVTHVNPTATEKKELDAKKKKSLQDPEIAKLAKKWEAEYDSQKAHEKFYKEQDALLKKTYTFAPGREDSSLVTGIQDFDRRDDSLSPVRPYGLLATRAKGDGQYVYLLTKEGVRRIKVSSSTDGNDRVFLAFKRLEDQKPFEKDGYPKTDVVSLSGNTVKSNWPSEAESKKAGVDSFAMLDNPAQTAKKFGNNFVVIDYAKAPLTPEISSDAEQVFKEELTRTVKEVVASHKAQMEYLTHLDSNQKDLIQKDWKFKDSDLADFYTKRYDTALKSCDSLNVGSDDAATQILNNEHSVFPVTQKASNGTQNNDGTRSTR